MPTDPYVPGRLEDEPRQQPNLSPGVKLPPAEGWRADRPGELDGAQPHGPMLGVPGPNIGFALTLVNRAADRLVLAPGEHREDAVAVVAELAMQRAASFGRAPVIVDVDLAVQLLGYDAEAPADVRAWRDPLVRGAGHHYQHRRACITAIPLDALHQPPAAVLGQTAAVRAALAAAAAGTTPAPDGDPAGAATAPSPRG